MRPIEVSAEVLNQLMCCPDRRVDVSPFRNDPINYHQRGTCTSLNLRATEEVSVPRTIVVSLSGGSADPVTDQNPETTINAATGSHLLHPVRGHSAVYSLGSSTEASYSNRSPQCHNAHPLWAAVPTMKEVGDGGASAWSS